MKNKDAVCYVRLKTEAKAQLDKLAKEHDLPSGRLAADLIEHGLQLKSEGKITISSLCVTAKNK